jgi:hypothetical protein
MTNQPIEPGQTAEGDRGAAQQYSMMGARELAYLTLQANPPPVSVGYAIPVTEEQFAQATQMYLERIKDDCLQLWDQSYEQTMGKIPEAQFLQIFQSHEPLFLPQYQLMQQQLAEQATAGLMDPAEAEMQAQMAMQDPALQAPVPNPWLQGLMQICGYQAHKDLQRYARIRSRAEAA